MKSLIVDKGEAGYTDMLKVLRSLEPYYLNYNWLITDIMAYPKHKELDELFSRQPVWLSGERFRDALMTENFQFIWSVSSGFPKNVTIEDILRYPLPFADGYAGFWVDNVGIQHPLAEVEIVAWDSSLTIFITKHEELAAKFKQGFPQAEDLSEQNRRVNAEMRRIQIIQIGRAHV